MKSLIHIIDSTFQSTHGQPSKSKPAFRPSSLGSPCLRKIYYSYHRVPEDFGMPLNVLKIMKLGDSIHELISGSLRKAGVLIDYTNPDGSVNKNKSGDGTDDFEFPLKDPDLELSAKMDAIMIIDGELEIGEWKSINKDGFKKLKDPKPEHLVQGAMYLYVARVALARGDYSHIKELSGFETIKRVRFLYYCKDTSEMKEYILDDLSEAFAQTVDKMMKVKEHTSQGTLPNKTQDWCSSCSYRNKCAREFKV